MVRPSYGRWSDTVNTPTEILASSFDTEKIGIQVDLTACVGAYASYTTACTGANNDLVFTAKKIGVVGNQIEVVYTDTDQSSTTVTVADGVITVDLKTTTGTPSATANEVMAAVNAHAVAGALVTASLAPSNDGTGTCTALAVTNLSGGVEAGSIPKGTIMGRVTASGLYVPYDDDGTDDGRRVAVGILVDDIDSTVAVDDQNDLRAAASMYIRGTFYYDKLIGLDSNGITDLNARYLAGANLLVL